jgi:hypothetical protein
MSTLVDEQPAAPADEPRTDGELQASGQAAPGGGPAEGPASHPCPNCGAAMQPGQEWCLQCGAAAPGALERAPWRSTGLIVAVIAALALGAAAAAVAALNQHAPARATVTSIVAQAPATPPPAATPTPAPTTPPASTTTPLPKASPKLPKVPATASTPVPPVSTGTSTTGPGTKGESQGSAPSGNEGTGSGEESSSNQPAALLLDTDAASTYNPYSLPAGYFGDPSLTIDGDHGTSWTAQVNPATAPKMAEGVLIDLKSLKKLSALELASTSKGMVVQVYGTAEKQAPTSITDPGWVPLSAPLALKKTTTRFKLRKPKQGFRYILAWISKAPTSAVGTPTAPGHVLVGEVELFPAS